MKLPEIFKNKLDENINNNEKTYISSNKEERLEVENEDLLNSLPVKVRITTSKYENELITIVGRTKNYIITKNRDVIYIKDIKDIKKAS